MRILTAIAALCISFVAAAADVKGPIVGLWQLESFDTEYKDTGAKKPIFGTKPKGTLLFSPGGRILSLLTSDTRPKADSDANIVTNFRSAYSVAGTYAVKGERYTAKVEASWNESLVGQELGRGFKVEKDKLTVTTDWGPSAIEAGNPVTRSVTVWRRIR
jgi:lipocalin-like protein